MSKRDFTVTEHPYIIKESNVCGGRPIIKGTRTTVQAIVEYYRLGLSTTEILGELPYITEAQLYDSLSYFHDHKEEILEGIDMDHKFVEKHNKENLQKRLANV